MIDVDLRRPFDFDDGFSAAGGLRYEYSDEAEAWNPIGSVTVNNNWESDAGKFGAMVSVSHQDRDFVDQVNFVTAPFILPDAVVSNPESMALNVAGEPAMAPNVIGGYFRYGDRVRDSFNASFQWAPNANSSYYLDVFGVQYEQNSQLNFWVPIPSWGGWSNGYVTKYKEGSNVAQEVVRPDAPGTITSNQSFFNESETYQYAGGGEWILENMTIKSDLAYTDTQANNRGFILDLAFFADTIVYDFSKNGAGISDVTILDANGDPYDMTDESQYYLWTNFDSHSHQDGDALDWTVDVNYPINSSWINSVDVGVRLSHRSAFNQEADSAGRGNISGNDVLLTDFPGMADYTPANYMGDVTTLNNTQWLTPSASYILENREDIREAMGYSRADPEYLPAKYYDNTEKNYAAYAQANFSSEINDMYLDGQFGVLFVQLKSELNGNNITDGVVTPINVNTSANELLPALNLRLQVTDDVYLRGSYGETISRPNFADLNPSATYFLPSETGTVGYGSGGNPELSAVKSKNYDFSAEWYFGETSFVSASYFCRDIDGYVKYVVAEETLNGNNFAITRPVNSGAGTLKGTEFAYTQFFDDLPGVLSGIGVQLNATFMDNEAENAEGVMEPLPNVSDESYNAVLMYEQDGLSARLAYNWRSEWYGSFNEVGDQPGSSVVHDPISSLDFSLNYDLNEHVTLTFDGTNLTDDVANDYFGGDSSLDSVLYPRDTYIRDRTFSVGVRVRM